MAYILFVCSKNQWRSPTAQLLFKNNQQHIAKSAGTSSKARIKVNQKLIDWADVIFVMERKHKELLEKNFGSNRKKIKGLNIEDNYQFGDPELIEILKAQLAKYL